MEWRPPCFPFDVLPPEYDNSVAADDNFADPEAAVVPRFAARRLGELIISEKAVISWCT